MVFKKTNAINANNAPFKNTKQTTKTPKKKSKKVQPSGQYKAPLKVRGKAQDNFLSQISDNETDIQDQDLSKTQPKIKGLTLTDNQNHSLTEIPEITIPEDIDNEPKIDSDRLQDFLDNTLTAAQRTALQVALQIALYGVPPGDPRSCDSFSDFSRLRAALNIDNTNIENHLILIDSNKNLFEKKEKQCDYTTLGPCSLFNLLIEQGGKCKTPETVNPFFDTPEYGSPVPASPSRNSLVMSSPELNTPVNLVSPEYESTAIQCSLPATPRDDKLETVKVPENLSDDDRHYNSPVSPSSPPTPSGVSIVFAKNVDKELFGDVENNLSKTTLTASLPKISLPLVKVTSKTFLKGRKKTRAKKTCTNGVMTKTPKGKTAAQSANNAATKVINKLPAKDDSKKHQSKKTTTSRRPPITVIKRDEKKSTCTSYKPDICDECIQKRIAKKKAMEEQMRRSPYFQPLLPQKKTIKKTIKNKSSNV